MKDLGLVAVYSKIRSIVGPVAILLKNDTHFLGAYISISIDWDEKLVLELIPNECVGATHWPRHYPYSERLLKRVAALETVSPAELGKEEAQPSEQIRVYGRQEAIDSDETAPKPRISPEVAAIKADLEHLMGKYEQVVKKD